MLRNSEAARVEHAIRDAIERAGHDGALFSDLEQVDGFAVDIQRSGYVPTLAVTDPDQVELQEDGTPNGESRVLLWRGHSPSAQVALFELARLRWLHVAIVGADEYPSGPVPRSDGPSPRPITTYPPIEVDPTVPELWLPLRFFAPGYGGRPFALPN